MSTETLYICTSLTTLVNHEKFINQVSIRSWWNNNYCGLWIIILVMSQCYITIIITEEIEYEDDFRFIHTLKEILTTDYSLLKKNSKFQEQYFTFTCFHKKSVF